MVLVDNEIRHITLLLGTPYLVLNGWYNADPSRSRTGRKGPYAGYYVQIQPGGSFIGAGLWHPEAAPLALMRRAIDRKSEKLKNVLLEPAMRKEFLKAVAKDEKKVVKAFVDANSGDMLKTKPKVNFLPVLVPARPRKF